MHILAVCARHAVHLNCSAWLDGYWLDWLCHCAGAERSLDTVVRAVSAAVLPVWVDFTSFSLKGLPCAPGPATTRRGMLVTNG